VVRRARQRRQDEELEQIDRQLALDDADIALDRGRCVAREAQDISGIGSRRRGATLAASRGIR
jgi:hypothetical protein